MAGQNKLTPEQQRRQLAEEMWLLYFNQALFEQGIITESKRNQMVHLITSRCSNVEKQHSKQAKLYSSAQTLDNPDRE